MTMLMEKTNKFFRLTTAAFFLAGIVFFISAQNVNAAPDIISKNLTGSGPFEAGQTITFSGDVYNQGTAMDTTNSYRYIKIGQTAASDGDAAYLNIAISGNYAYIGSRAGGDDLEVFDISNPSAPVKIGGLNWMSFNSVGEIVISGNYAYVGSSDLAENRFAVINISNPANPILVKKVAVPGDNNFVQDVDISGNYVFAVTWHPYNDFFVFDISNPANTAIVFSLDLAPREGATGIAIAGNYAYLVGDANSKCDGINSSELSIFNISNPLAPVQISTLELYPSLADCGSSFNIRPNDIVVSGNYAYIGGNDAVFTIDISNPASPVQTSKIASDRVYSIHLNSSFLYAVTEFTGVNVYGLANPASPQKVSNIGGRDPVDPSANRYYDIAFTTNDVFISRFTTVVGTVARFETYEPHVYARFCIDNANCLTSTTGRIGGADLDAGKLGVGASKTVSAAWTATAGNHTIFFCSDPKSGSYDGVAESNETNNCSSQTFVVTQCIETLVSPVWKMKAPDGTDVLAIDNSGNIKIYSATIHTNTPPPASGLTNTLIIKNGSTNIFSFDKNDAYITGNVFGNQGSMPAINSNDLIVKDTAGNIVAFFDTATGNIYLKGGACL